MGQISSEISFNTKKSQKTYIRFFRMSQNLQILGKSVSILICNTHFLRYRKFLIGNNIGYDFCVFQYLGFKRIAKEVKIRPSRNYRIYGSFLINIYTNIISFPLFVLSSTSSNWKTRGFLSQNLQEKYLRASLIINWNIQLNCPHSGDRVTNSLLLYREIF